MGLGGMGISLSFTLANWFFAHKYWVLSYKIPSMIDKNLEAANMTKPKIVNILMISITVIVSVSGTSIFFGLVSGAIPEKKSNEVLLYLFIMSAVVIDFVSCLVLYSAFRTIGEATEHVQQLNIKKSMMDVH